MRNDPKQGGAQLLEPSPQCSAEAAANPSPRCSCGDEGAPNANWFQFGLLAAWGVAGIIGLILCVQELYQQPELHTMIMGLAILVWTYIMFFLAHASLNCTAEWQFSNAMNLVAFWGIASPNIMSAMGCSFPMQRGYPAVEASIVSLLASSLGILTPKAMVLLHALYMTTSILTRQKIGFTYLFANLAIGFPSSCILCLARNRPTWSSTGIPSFDAAASAAAAPAVKATCAIASLSAAAVSVYTTYARAGFCASSAALPGLARALAVAGAVAAVTGAVSAATTAWQPPCIGCLGRFMHNPMIARALTMLGLGGLQPVPPSQSWISALIFPPWVQKAELSLLKAVPQGAAETALATLAALFIAVRFFLMIASVLTSTPYAWSPTQDMLSLFLGITVGSSQAEHLRNLWFAQIQAYKSVRTLLQGFLPSHIVQAMENDLEQMQRGSEGTETPQRTSVGSLQANHLLLKRCASRNSAPTLGSTAQPELQAALHAAASSTVRKVTRSISLPSSAMCSRVSSDTTGGQPRRGSTELPPDLFHDHDPYQEKHENVAVLFCDIESFTALSERIEPSEVMVLLSNLYKQFDELAAALSLYPVDTIGDCYICAANLVGAQPQGHHVDLLVTFGLSILQIAKHTITPLGTPLRVRVGIHTGPVIAGLLGSRRMKFTVVGDSVNVASRMQSNASPNTLLVSEAAFQQLHSPQNAAAVTAAAAAASASGSFDGATFEGALAALLSHTHHYTGLRMSSSCPEPGGSSAEEQQLPCTRSADLTCVHPGLIESPPPSRMITMLQAHSSRKMLGNGQSCWTARTVNAKGKGLMKAYLYVGPLCEYVP